MIAMDLLAMHLLFNTILNLHGLAYLGFSVNEDAFVFMQSEIHYPI